MQLRSRSTELYSILFCALIASGFSACTAEPAPAVARIDSSEAVQLSLADSPLLVIGVQDYPETHALHQPLRPQLVDGRLYVGNARREIRVFSETGQYIATIGRQGGGPGEFGNLAAFRRLPDGRFVTLDGNGQRVQTLDSAGAELRTYVPTVLRDPNVPVSFLDDGRVVALENSWPLGETPEPQVVRRRVDLLVFDSLDGHVARLGTIPGFPWWTWGSGRTGQPLGPRPFLTTAGSVVVYSDGGGYRIHAVNLSTGRRIEAWLDLDPPAVTSAMLAAWEDEVRAYYVSLGMPATRPAYQPGWQEMTPDSLPGYLRLAISDDGCVWAQRFRIPGTSPLIWDVIDVGRQQHIGTMSVPETFAISGIRQRTVIGIRTDELGVQQVILYPIEGSYPADGCILE